MHPMQGDGVTRDEREHAEGETPRPQSSTPAHDNSQFDATTDTLSEADRARQSELHKPAQLPDTERMTSPDGYRTGASGNDTGTTDTPPVRTEIAKEATTDDIADSRSTEATGGDAAPGMTNGDATPRRRIFARFRPQPGFDWVSFAVLGDRRVEQVKGHLADIKPPDARRHITSPSTSSPSAGGRW